VSRATFETGSGTVGTGGNYNLIARQLLPAGSFAIQANVRIQYGGAFGDPTLLAADCQLRKNGTDIIGAAVDSRLVGRTSEDAMLPLNGGVFSSASVFADVWCQGNSAHLASAQLMAIQVGGFFGS
jgi:hypothetical protein